MINQEAVLERESLAGRFLTSADYLPPRSSSSEAFAAEL